MFCYNCGTKMEDGDVFCWKCGSKVASQDAAIPEPVSQASVISGQAISQPNAGYVDKDDFRAYVDSHVKKKTKKQSALELMNSRDLLVLICWGIPVAFGVFAFGAFFLLVAVWENGLAEALAAALVAALVASMFGFLCTYPILLICNWTLKVCALGKIPKKTNIDVFLEFLNGHLSYLSPYLHEWGYIKYKNQEQSAGRSALEGTLVGGVGMGLKMGYYAELNNALMQSAVMCTPVGEKQKYLLVIHMKPDRTNSEQIICSIGIERRRRGKDLFLSQGPSSDVLGAGTHTWLIKTAPILQAAIEYYLRYNNA